jgi:hypothetical protein
LDRGRCRAAPMMGSEWVAAKGAGRGAPSCARKSFASPRQPPPVASGMRHVVMMVGLVTVLSWASAESLWAGARLGMSESEVLAATPGATLLPDDERESDLFGTSWSVAAKGVRLDDLEGVATFGFDDAALRVVKLDFASSRTGWEADAQCAGLIGTLTERHGAAGATERQTILGLSFTQATWLDGPLVVVAMCMSGAQGSSFFVGIRPLTTRELEAQRTP